MLSTPIPRWSILEIFIMIVIFRLMVNALGDTLGDTLSAIGGGGALHAIGLGGLQ